MLARPLTLIVIFYFILIIFLLLIIKEVFYVQFSIDWSTFLFHFILLDCEMFSVVAGDNMTFTIRSLHILILFILEKQKQYKKIAPTHLNFIYITVTKAI